MSANPDGLDTVRSATAEPYKYGFVTDIESEMAPRGLNADIVRFISAKNDEPEWLLKWRLKAFEAWLTRFQPAGDPTWANVRYPAIDYQDAYYYAAPKEGDGPKSLDEIDPAILRTYEKLGIPLAEQERLAGVAIDAVFDSVSVATTFKAALAKKGVIFCPMSEAVREHPELVRRYLGSVVPYADNAFATLNSAVFSDGSFAYIPPGVRCPMGAFDVLPHQRREHRPVRAHADHRRCGKLRELSRRLHRAHARREPAPCRGGRTRRPRGRRDQVLDGAELVPRR